MSDAQTFLAFGAVMVLIALVAVGIDWFGKPMRHRRFVPSIYRFPEERTPRGSSVRRTEWSDSSFVLPVAGPLPHRGIEPDPIGPGGDFPTPLGDADGAGTAHRRTQMLVPEPAIEEPAVDQTPAADEFFDQDADSMVDIGADAAPGDPEPTGPPERPSSASPNRRPAKPRGRGWAPGDFVYNLTAEGREPSAATVSERYWTNVGSTRGATAFGDDNVDRMLAGRPPRRRNPRTATVESMELPVPGYDESGGRTPVPAWPDGVARDPFAQ